MARQHLRINRFGFAEYDDMIELAREADVDELVHVLNSIVDLILTDDLEFFDSLPEAVEGDLVVPLGMCAKMLPRGDYSPMELVSGACTVRYSAEPHMAEFPGNLVELVSRLPR